MAIAVKMTSDRLALLVVDELRFPAQVVGKHQRGPSTATAL
jgi:hypothetical protein